MRNVEHNTYLTLKTIIEEYFPEPFVEFWSTTDIFKAITSMLSKMFNKNYKIETNTIGFIISCDEDEMFFQKGDFVKLLTFYKSECILNKISLVLN